MSDWQTELSDLITPAVKRSQIVKEVIIDHGAIAQTGKLLKRHFAGRKAIIVTDTICNQIAGDLLRASLRDADFTVETLVVDEHHDLSASVEIAKELCPQIAGEDLIPIALGSGIIHDLLKYATLRNDQQYCSVATAASMDGYVSPIASLTNQGFKTVFPGRLPLVVIGDLNILCAAPAKLNSHGYGDIAGKITGGVDWMIADSLGIEAIDEDIFALVQDNLARWLAHPEKLRDGDPGTTALLFGGLVIVGLAMERYGSSRPASGAEHNIAHCWEMESLTYEGKKVAHGACVAVGTIAILQLYEWLLRQDLTTLDTDRIIATTPDLDHHFAQIELSFTNPQIIEQAKQQITNKHPTLKQLRERIDTLKSVWPELQTKLRSRLLTSKDVAAMLRLAGAPCAPGDIGVNHTDYVRLILRSRYLRDRYTILDLLANIGMLEHAVESVT